MPRSYQHTHRMSRRRTSRSSSAASPRACRARSSIFGTTFRKTSALRDVSAGVWGFRGPLGAFLGAWGAATMVVSAPFDNWWHNAYGLDVKIYALTTAGTEPNLSIASVRVITGSDTTLAGPLHISVVD